MEQKRYSFRPAAVTCLSIFVIAAALTVTWRGNAHEVITTRITFNKEIVRILAKSCMSCHHTGGLAPMPLTNYQEARPWAKAIKEEVLEHRMPPWHSVTGYGEFANDPSLANREIDFITAWVDGGAPKGEDKDLRPLPDFDQAWSLGTPDLILPLDGSSTQIDENARSRCLVLHNASAKDQWIRAIDIQSGGSLQHAFIWIEPNGKRECGCLGASRFQPSGTLGAWVAGQQVTPLGKGVAQVLPAGARLLMQVHYREPSHQSQVVPRVGLYFAQEAVGKRLHTLPVMNSRFEIPPGAESFRVKATHMLKQDSEAVAVLPHMHRLGESIEVAAFRPDGSRETLVWVRSYDFDWQSIYTFKRPVPLPAGTRIEVTAYYDNSDRNPRNPNHPPASVRSGPSFQDEMCVVYLDYILKNESQPQGNSRR
jgi:hypothetical protein